MSEPPTSRVEILPYGPMTREESIAKIKKCRRKISSALHGLDDHIEPPEKEESAFWAGHAAMITQWVTESQFREFFEPEREANENAVQDLEEVLYGEETMASANENGHVHRVQDNLPILQFKWVGLARECLHLARLFLPDLLGIYRPRLSSSNENDIQHMLEVMQAKRILFMAEQARYGDLAARKELVRLLIMDGDCKPRRHFPCSTAKFTAEIIAKYDLISEKIHPRNNGFFNDIPLSRIKYWCLIFHQDAYMGYCFNGRESFHIAPKQLGMCGWVLAFAEPGNRLWWPSNGLFIERCVGVSLQNLDFVIVPSGSPDSEDLEIHVLDKRKLKPLEYFDKGAKPCCRRISFQRRKLVFKNSERPNRKVLYFQWLMAVLKWILDPEEEGLDSELACQELSRHDEIWGTSGEYVRQELLEAVAEKSGIEIPTSNAIPAGRVSDADMAEILHEVMCDEGRYFHRKSADNDYWRCWKRGNHTIALKYTPER